MPNQTKLLKFPLELKKTINKCSNCFNSFIPQDLIVLNCKPYKHKFCVCCFQEQVIILWKTKCPMESCNSSIDMGCLANHPKTLEAYKELIMLKTLKEKDANSESKEKIIKCPVDSGAYYILKDSTYFSCPKCKKKYCNFKLIIYIL